MSKTVKVLCANTGNSSRKLTIDGTTYLLDTYDINTLITALQTVRDVTFSTVDCRIEKG